MPFRLSVDLSQDETVQALASLLLEVEAEGVLRGAESVRAHFANPARVRISEAEFQAANAAQGERDI